MRPTPRALELAAPIRQALTQLNEALEPVEFVPASASRAFTFAMADHAASLILPALAERLEKLAPYIDIRVKPNTNINAPELLDSGEINFAVGLFPNPPERLHVAALIRDEYVCAMRRNHPLARKPLDLDGYLSAKHLLVSLSGEPTGFVDILLESQGLRRRIAMTVNQCCSDYSQTKQSCGYCGVSGDHVVPLCRRISYATSTACHSAQCALAALARTFKPPSSQCLDALPTL